MIIICAFIFAFWFEREFQQFPQKIIRQVYDDCATLAQLPLTFAEFEAASSLKTQALRPKWLFKLLFPATAWLCEAMPLPIIAVSLILLYLAYLDYCYYLTDSRYLIAIFLLSMLYLLAYSPFMLPLGITNLLLSAGFFISLHTISRLVSPKILLGSGDIFLFCALAPLFTLEQMLLLLLMTSLSGLLFAFGYFCQFRRKIDRLPLIPFITFASITLFLLHF